ncbi:MAG: 2-oxo acid dehydrogenase subunit E2 [bacterium]
MKTTSAGPGYRIVDFARIREAVIDVLVPAEKKHMIHVLFEADVTDVHKHLRERKAEAGKAPSLTAFLIKCTADAAMTDRRLTAVRVAPRKLALFDDMHVNCMVETSVDGQSHPLSRIIRQANRKSVQEVHEDLSAFTEEEKQAQLRTVRKFAKLPRSIRSVLMASFVSNPKKIPSAGFNVLFTSVGMFGAGGGHVLPYTQYPLCIGVGGISKKPGLVEDRIEPREFLSITVTYDHDITDGAPAARFAQALKDLIEKGHGLLAEPA